MDDALGMDEIKATQDLSEQIRTYILRQLTLILRYHLSQAASIHQLDIYPKLVSPLERVQTPQYVII